MIQALFNAKRQMLQTLNAVGTGIHEGFGQFSDSLANLYSLSLGQINLAVNTTSIFTFQTIPTTFAWDNIINRYSINDLQSSYASVRPKPLFWFRVRSQTKKNQLFVNFYTIENVNRGG